jgi:hypothetical protein
MDYKPILKVIPAIQSVALLKKNADFALKKKKKSGDFLKVGIGNIAGAAFIQAEADLIG